MTDETAVSEEFKDTFIRQFFEQWINPDRTPPQGWPPA
jgi:hypothetical protein